MPTIIPVRFTYAARDLWFDPAGTGAQEGDHVICATERGQEFGLATGDAREVTGAELEAFFRKKIFPHKKKQNNNTESDCKN